MLDLDAIERDVYVGAVTRNTPPQDAKIILRLCRENRELRTAIREAAVRRLVEKVAPATHQGSERDSRT